MKTIFCLLASAFLYVSCANTPKNPENTIASSAAAHSKDVPTRAEDVKPVLIGSKLPSIALSQASGGQINLAEAVQSKPMLLIFYRGGWCPYCNVQLQDLRKIEGPLSKLGYQIVAVSPDQPDLLKSSVDKNKIGYTLVSDSKGELMRAMGIAFRVDDETVGKYKGYGIDLEAASGQNHHWLPVPSVFIIDRTGTVTFSYVNPDYRIRLPAPLILSAAETEFKALKTK